MLAIGILNTSIGSGNVGDQIIMDATMSHLAEVVPDTQLVQFSSHDAFLYNALKLQTHVSRNFLCGTNCLSSHMLLRPSWAVNFVTALFIKPVVTIGVGWGGYQDRPDFYTRELLKKVLSKEGLLSVRDNYTKLKLESCGFDNVINTGCPTLWNLTEEHCRLIPTSKSSKVVYTFTDYARDGLLDLRTLKILSENYESVFIWIQGTKDLEYLAELYKEEPAFFDKLGAQLIPPSLQAYDKFLQKNNVDYVGTRLHGGIRALQKQKRTIIIAVDNRAEEKRRDFSMPVIKREDIGELDGMINGGWSTEISLPRAEIDMFKSFLRNLNSKSLDGFSFI